MKGFLSCWMVNSKNQNRRKASYQLVLFERQITYRSSVCVRVLKGYIEFKNCNYF